MTTTDRNVFVRIWRRLSQFGGHVPSPGAPVHFWPSYEEAAHPLPPPLLSPCQPSAASPEHTVFSGAAMTAGSQLPALAWDPGACNLTDLGNAQRMVALHGSNLRFCGARKRWLVWDGMRWTVDDTGAAERRAKDTARRMYGDASLIGDETKGRSLASFALNSESLPRLRAMMELAKSEPGMGISPEELDKDPMLLNVLNGTIDLRTGKLHHHRRDDLMTKLAPVKYDPGAEAPTWDGFLEEIMSSNRRLIRFLQIMAGYALTGETSEQVMFVLHGQGANGKSTFVNTLSVLLGDYALQTPIQTLVVTRGSHIPNDLARLVIAAEAEQGQVLAESLVKQLTGGDKIAARYLYGEWFEFVPTFKIFLITNHRPRILGTDEAIWRRIRLVPFSVRIPDDRQDRHLPIKLQEELPGVLNWAIQGLLAWQRVGLAMPPEVEDATEGYRYDMDQVGRFLAESCVQEALATVGASELYQAYQDWCQASGEQQISQKGFGLELARRGFEKKRDRRGYRYLGLGLSPKNYEEGGV
jgi:putative DNA primase/helicase